MSQLEQAFPPADVLEKLKGVDGSSDIEVAIPGQSKPLILKKALIQDFLQICRDVSPANPELTLLIGKPGSGAMKIHYTDYIVVDPLLARDNPGQGRFVVSHEAAHDAITVPLGELGLSRVYVKELSQKLGYHYLHNMVEDPVVNDFATQRRQDLKFEQLKFYDKQFGKQNAVLGTPEINAFVSQLGYAPKFAHFASEIMRDWHTGAFSKSLDPAVTRSLSQVIYRAREAIKCLPQTLDSREVIDKARQRFLIVHEYLWPEIEKLIESDVEDERRRQQGEQALGSKKNDSGKGANQSRPDSSGNIPDPQGASKSPSNNGDIPAPELSPETQKELERLKQKSNSEGKPSFSPQDLSPEARRELDRAYAELSDEDKEKLKAKAKQALKNVEDKVNHELNPKRFPPPVDPKEQEKQDSQPDLGQLSLPPDFKTIHNMTSDLELDRKANLSAWDREFEAASEKIDQIYHRLRKKILLERYPDWESGHAQGQEFDLFTAMQSESDPRLKAKIFKNRVIPTKEDWSISVVVDTSPSIKQRGADLPQFQAVVFINELFFKLQSETSVTEFSGKVENLKTWEDSITNQEVREKLSKLLETSGGTTQDGDAIEAAYDDLKKTRTKYKLIIIFSDAESGQSEKLGQVMNQICEDQQTIVMHYGVGPRTSDTLHYYPISYGDLAINGVAPSEKSSRVERTEDQQMGEMVARMYALDQPAANPTPSGSEDFYETFYQTFLDVMLKPKLYLQKMSQYADQHRASNPTQVLGLMEHVNG